MNKDCSIFKIAQYSMVIDVDHSVEEGGGRRHAGARGVMVGESW